MTGRNDRVLIDRAALVDFMERLAARLETKEEISDSYVRGYKFALDDVKIAPRVRLPEGECNE